MERGSVFRRWPRHQQIEMLEAVVAASPVAIFTLDAQGRIRSANAAAERLFAKPASSLTGTLLGVGFSSFSYLRALSADYVKIDRSFVSDVDTNPTNRALIQAVMTVAQTLGKEVIAEGVETGAHEAVLR
jgi:nitrogen fixation/metabolism regulation signal transduction histidine kinase